MNESSVMTWLTRECAVSIGLKRGIRELHDGLVRSIKSGFIADESNL